MTTEATFDVSDGVVSGEEVAVSATSGDTAAVVWRGRESERSDVLEEFVVPRPPVAVPGTVWTPGNSRGF